MRPDLARSWLLPGLLALAACSEQPIARVVDPPPVNGQSDAGTPAPDGGVARSSRNNLRRKGPERLNTDFAAALSLPPEQVCNELGQYSCANKIHTVTLGGVEPYGSGLYEPLPASGVTSPIAVDRLALAACARRASLDVATPTTAVIFAGVALDASGRLASREGPEVRAAITTLYQRGLLREPTGEETTALVQLAADVESSGSPRPGRDWMTAACFVVLSSAESVFF